MKRYCYYFALCLALLGATAAADDRDTYNRQSAERFMALFKASDINHDNAVSREEAADDDRSSWPASTTSTSTATASSRGSS